MDFTLGLVFKNDVPHRIEKKGITKNPADTTHTFRYGYPCKFFVTRFFLLLTAGNVSYLSSSPVSRHTLRCYPVSMLATGGSASFRSPRAIRYIQVLYVWQNCDKALSPFWLLYAPLTNGSSFKHSVVKVRGLATLPKVRYPFERELIIAHTLCIVNTAISGRNTQNCATCTIDALFLTFVAFFLFNFSS